MDGVIWAKMHLKSLATVDNQNQRKIFLIVSF